jgi:hypothetical protein
VYVHTSINTVISDAFIFRVCVRVRACLLADNVCAQGTVVEVMNVYYIKIFDATQHPPEQVGASFLISSYTKINGQSLHSTLVAAAAPHRALLLVAQLT